VKRVFSKEKYIEDRGYEEYQESVLEDGHSWIDECDGKTKEECLYEINNDWCVEVEENEN